MNTLTMLFTLISITAYFMPVIVSVGRKHKNQLSIAVLNLLVGWTILGWIVAIVWACTDNVRRSETDDLISEAELLNSAANSQLRIK
jgi:hypothetical protein